MKNILILLLLPFTASGQSLLEKSDKVYNVYRRDSTVIHSYNLEFAKRIKKADGVDNGNSVVAHISKSYKGEKCLSKITVSVNLILQSKDNRSKLSFDTVRYTAESGECRLSGTLIELLECGECKHYTRQLKYDYTQFVDAIYNEYKEFLKEKSNDENW